MSPTNHESIVNLTHSPQQAVAHSLPQVQFDTRPGRGTMSPDQVCADGMWYGTQWSIVVTGSPRVYMTVYVGSTPTIVRLGSEFNHSTADWRFAQSLLWGLLLSNIRI